MAPVVDRFLCRCLSDTLDGLQDGLSHYSGPSRAAVIFTPSPEAPVCICDPQNLLRGHEPKLKEIYLEQAQWRDRLAADLSSGGFDYMVPEKNLQLAGLVSNGGGSRAMFTSSG